MSEVPLYGGIGGTIRSFEGTQGECLIQGGWVELQGLGFRVLCLWLRVLDFRFMMQGLGCCVYGL